jgi:AmpE protein
LYRNILSREAHHLFAILFWVIALGYGAALFYVLNYRLMRSGDAGGDTEEVARLWHTALFWIPGRLLVLCMGLAGDWHRVSSAVSGRLWDLSETEPLLQDALAAALNRGDTPPGDLQAAMDTLEAQQGLLLRCLALWLLLAAVWVLLVT